MDRSRRALTRRALLLAPGVTFLGIMFLYPLASIADRGFRPGGRFSLSGMGAVLGDADLRRVIAFTIGQAVASTALTLAIGMPAAYALARYRFRGHALVRAVAIAPFALPTVVVGTAFVALLGDGGPVSAAFGWLGLGVSHLDRSLGGLFLAHAFLNVAIVVLVVGTALSMLDPDIEAAATVLGAGRVRAAVSGPLAAARSAILGAAALVFCFTFTSFGVVLILSGPGRSTIEVEIYRQTTQLLNLPVASALTLIQIAVVATLLVVTARIQSRAGGVDPHAQVRAARRPETRRERAFVTAAVGVVGLLALAPIAVLLTRALYSPGGFTLDRFVHLGDVRKGGLLAVSPLAAIGNSLVFAGIAAAIAVGLGGLAAAALAAGRRHRGVSLGLLTVPLGVSAVTLGFGAILAFNRPPLELRGSFWLVPLVEAVVALPLVLRVLTPALQELDGSPREAASVLGASPWQVRRHVVLPLVWRSVVLAFAFAAVVALGEFGATIFVARIDRPTVPVAIARLLERPGSASVGQAMALSCVLAFLTMGVILAIERIRPHGFGRL